MELKLAKMNQPYRDNREIIEDYKVLISSIGCISNGSDTVECG